MSPLCGIVVYTCYKFEHFHGFTLTSWLSLILQVSNLVIISFISFISRAGTWDQFFSSLYSIVVYTCYKFERFHRFTFTSWPSLILQVSNLVITSFISFTTRTGTWDLFISSLYDIVGHTYYKFERFHRFTLTS